MDLNDFTDVAMNYDYYLPIIQAKQMHSSPGDFIFRAEYVNSEGKREQDSGRRLPLGEATV